jgi:hypothetical protein
MNNEQVHWQDLEESDQLINSIYGDIPQRGIRVKHISIDHGDHISMAREWYRGGEMIRRDAWVTMKQAVAGAIPASMGGK